MNRFFPIVAFIFGSLVFTYFLLGVFPSIIFAIAFAGGFILWMKTTYHTPINPTRLILPYLITIILFILHVYEEYLTDFELVITDLSGIEVEESSFLTVAAFFGPIIWLLGAILLVKRTDLGYFLLSFFFVAMALAELSHFVFPFLQSNHFHYVSGMYTAALPLIPAGYGLYVLFDELKKERNLSTNS